MGWPLIASIALTVAGVIVENKARSAAAKKTRRAIETQDENQDPFRQKASQMLGDTSDKLDPNLRMQKMKDADQKSLQKFAEISDKNKKIREDSVFKGGNITELERYDETGGAEREAKRVRDMTNAARFFSPTQTNLDERRMVGELAGNMDTNRNFARGQFNVDQQIIDSIRPDEGMMMLAGILKGAGTATGFYGAGANIAAEQATKKAIEEAAVKTAIESTIPSTAARWSLGEGAKGIVSSAGSNVLAPTASGIGSSATMFGVPPGAQDIGRQMMLPTTDSTARMFGAGNNTIAPFNAANSGVQNRSYQLWNLPYR